MNPWRGLTLAGSNGESEGGRLPPGHLCLASSMTSLNYKRLPSFGEGLAALRHRRRGSRSTPPQAVPTRKPQRVEALLTAGHAGVDPLSGEDRPSNRRSKKVASPLGSSRACLSISRMPSEGRARHKFHNFVGIMPLG